MEEIDYSPAGPLARVVRAHAIIESNESLYAVGDGGQALGLLQIHPGMFHDYYGRLLEFPALNSDTWVEAWIKTTATFHRFHGFLTGTEDHQHLLVQAYNKGFSAVFSHGQRNPEYLSRWLAAFKTC